MIEFLVGNLGYCFAVAGISTLAYLMPLAQFAFDVEIYLD